MRWRVFGPTLASVGLLCGCAGGPSGPGDGQAGGVVTRGDFPAPEALESLRQQPQPGGVFDRGIRDVETWELRGPFPERVAVEPWSDESPASLALAEVARRRPGLVVPTRAMHCVARELGLFYLAHDGAPPEALRRAIRGLCRAAGPYVRFGTLQGKAPPEASDAEVLERWSEQVDSTLRNQLVGGPRTAGAWLGRDGERVLLMVAAAERSVHLDPIAGVGSDGRIHVEGETLEPVREVSAVVSRGRLGFAFCSADPELELPRFAFDCSLDPGDRSTWLAVTVFPPERLIGKLATELLLWPRGDVDPVYRRPSYVESREAWDEDTAAAGFVELLNEVRGRGELAPLELDPEQSEIARELALPFFEATLGLRERSVADLVVMGLLAGWSVDGIVRSGHFAASWTEGNNDIGRLLSEALDQPTSRSALLADDVERVAIGPLLEVNDGTPAMAVIVGTYGLFSEESHATHVARVFEQLAEARAERRQPAPRRLDELEELSMNAAGSVEAGVVPQDALRELLHASGAALKRSVRGWVVETSELEDLSFPEELLADRQVWVSIGVSSYRPEGEAWGRYVVLIVAAEPGRGV
jgi:hypothetical protein